LYSIPGLADPAVAENPFAEYSQQGQATPYLQIANFSFYVGAPNIHGKAYVPNFSTLAGLRLGWKDYLISSSFALPIPKEEIDRRGKTEQFNFVVNKYWRQSAIDLYYQKYRGFYAGNPVSEFSLSKPDRFTQFPNAYSVNYGFNYYYALNDNQYSFKSAFAYKEAQVQSGGSPLLHMFYNHLELSLGDIIIPGNEPDAIQTMPTLQDVALETFGAGYGYGYTWVIDRYLVTTQVVAAAGLQGKTGTTTPDLAKSIYTLALKGNANLSLAYHLDKGVVGLRFLMDSLYSKTNNEQIYSTLMVGTLFYLHRF
jgi:hypothetical protein